MDRIAQLALGLDDDKNELFKALVEQIRSDERKNFSQLLDFLKNSIPNIKDKKFSSDLAVLLRNLGEDTEDVDKQPKKKKSKILCSAFTKKGQSCPNEGRPDYDGLCGTHRNYKSGKEQSDKIHNHDVDNEIHSDCDHCQQFGNIGTLGTSEEPVVPYNQFDDADLNDF